MAKVADHARAIGYAHQRPEPLERTTERHPVSRPPVAPLRHGLCRRRFLLRRGATAMAHPAASTQRPPLW